MSTAANNPFQCPSDQFSGDTFPIFRDGVCHLFHMMPPVIAHHVSRDLLHWEARPEVVALPDPGDAVATAQALAGDWQLAPRQATCRGPAGGTLLLPALPADA